MYSLTLHRSETQTCKSHVFKWERRCTPRKRWSVCPKFPHTTCTVATHNARSGGSSHILRGRDPKNPLQVYVDESLSSCSGRVKELLPHDGLRANEMEPEKMWSGISTLFHPPLRVATSPWMLLATHGRSWVCCCCVVAAVTRFIYGGTESTLNISVYCPIGFTCDNLNLYFHHGIHSKTSTVHGTYSLDTSLSWPSWDCPTKVLSFIETKFFYYF